VYDRRAGDTPIFADVWETKALSPMILDVWQRKDLREEMTRKCALGFELLVRFPCVASFNSTLAAPVPPTTFASARGSLNC
jgi:hypothetical protein